MNKLNLIKWLDFQLKGDAVNLNVIDINNDNLTIKWREFINKKFQSVQFRAVYC